MIARSTLANFGAREDTVCQGSRMPGGGRALGESSLRHGFHLLNLYMGWFRLRHSDFDLQRDTSGRNCWLPQIGNVDKLPLPSQVLKLAKCPTSPSLAVGWPVFTGIWGPEAAGLKQSENIRDFFLRSDLLIGRGDVARSTRLSSTSAKGRQGFSWQQTTKIALATSTRKQSHPFGCATTKRASIPSGTLLPTCWQRHFKSSTPAYSSVSDLL